MKCFATIALLAACVSSLVSAEPPAPQSQYLPPNQQVQQPPNNYLPPTQQYQSPNNNYLPPQRSQPPSNSYQAPAANGGPISAPQNSYGAPAVTSAIFTKQQPQQSTGGGYGGGNFGAGSQHGGNAGYGSGNSGYGNNIEENYGPAKYEFKYDVQDYESGNDFGHMESRDGDLAIGRYYVLLPDGRKQIVEYEADQNGYRPTIRYEQVNAGVGAGAGRGGGYDANAQAGGKFGGYQ